MQQKFGTCIQCGYDKPINSKGICPDCTFVNNHNGLSQAEYYQLKSKENKEKKQRDNKIPSHRKKINSTRKNLAKNERFEKRRQQIQLDEQTYEEVFNNSKIHWCENCHRSLNDRFRDDEGNIIARYQYSHIMGKKAFPEFRNDKRNFNRLCLHCHTIWDFGDKEKMRIYEQNQLIIEQLLKEKHENNF